MICGLGYSKKLKLKQKQSPLWTVNYMVWSFVLLILTEQLTCFYCIWYWRYRLWVCNVWPWQENNWTNKCFSKIVWKCSCCIPPHPVFGHELKSRFLVCSQLGCCWSQAGRARAVQISSSTSARSRLRYRAPFLLCSFLQWSLSECVCLCVLSGAPFLCTPHTVGRSLKA